ncbi:MAG: hypothetical protein HRU17_07970 [Polyangiaceae bacterium]|nr:hypothetical protein [Polyangiaceae bacterium]
MPLWVLGFAMMANLGCTEDDNDPNGSSELTQEGGSTDADFLDAGNVEDSGRTVMDGGMSDSRTVADTSLDTAIEDSIHSGGIHDGAIDSWVPGGEDGGKPTVDFLYDSIPFDYSPVEPRLENGCWEFPIGGVTTIASTEPVLRDEIEVFGAIMLSGVRSTINIRDGSYTILLTRDAFEDEIKVRFADGTVAPQTTETSLPSAYNEGDSLVVIVQIQRVAHTANVWMLQNIPSADPPNAQQNLTPHEGTALTISGQAFALCQNGSDPIF